MRDSQQLHFQHENDPEHTDNVTVCQKNHTVERR